MLVVFCFFNLGEGSGHFSCSIIQIIKADVWRHVWRAWGLSSFLVYALPHRVAQILKACHSVRFKHLLWLSELADTFKWVQRSLIHSSLLLVAPLCMESPGRLQVGPIEPCCGGWLHASCWSPVEVSLWFQTYILMDLCAIQNTLDIGLIGYLIWLIWYGLSKSYICPS